MLCTEVFPLCDGVSLCDGWACLPFFKLPLLILTSLQNDHLIPLTPNRSTTPFETEDIACILVYPPLFTPRFPFSHSGEIKSGNFLLEWLSDDDNRELVDEIEHVNPAMLDQLVAQSTYLAALFCEYLEKKYLCIPFALSSAAEVNGTSFFADLPFVFKFRALSFSEIRK